MNSTADIKSEVDNLRDILVRKDRRIELLEGLLAQANALKLGSSSEKSFLRANKVLYSMKRKSLVI